LQSALALVFALNLVLACGDDDETSAPNSGGSAATGGSAGSAPGGTDGYGAVAGQGGDPPSGAGAAGVAPSNTGGTGGSDRGSDGGVAGFSDEPSAGGDGGADSEVPLDGFGEISGDCGVIDAALLGSTSPALFRASFTFPDEDYLISDLSDGGVELSIANSSSGSSLESEIFAYEYLYRCELAEMLKTEDEVMYLDGGTKIDVLTKVDGEQLGVSAVRAVKFPFDEPYTAGDAKPVLEQKLEELLEASLNVGVEDTWKKPVLVVVAYSDAHADALEEAYETLDTLTKSDTLVFVVVTNGDDAFIYD
jgi:hypothetical protein